MAIRIRAILPEEWPAWQALRLRALEDSPDAFRSTLGDERAHPDEFWADLIGKTAAHPRGGLWIAAGDEAGVGMLFGRLDEDFTTLEIGAMWVAPELRGQGVGGRLLAVAMDWGRTNGVDHAELWVAEGNDAAMSLYRGCGFSPTLEREPLRTGSPHTVVKMTATLAGTAGAGA